MKILVIADEAWNDDIHGNNVLTNWFEGFDASFCEIYCSPGMPKNNICSSYFQLTDKEMFKSILFSTKAGNKIFLENNKDKVYEVTGKIEYENKKLYIFLKAITGDFLRLVRQIIWCVGKINQEQLNSFLEEEKPDIIFAPRKSSLKLLRLEKYVYNYADLPIVAYTGDDEYSLKQLKVSPFYWIYQFSLRKVMKKQIPNYSLYYTHSLTQAREYHNIFNIPTKQILKCGDFKKQKIHTINNKTLKFVYIGKLYCNRWKTLSLIAKELKEINKNGVKAILEIYTLEHISNRKKRLLHDNVNTFLMGGIEPNKIPEIYKNSDVLLHVESFDLKNKLLTQYSLSTKIIDCLSSGCALWAIGWEKHCGCQYLIEHDCAFVSTTKKEIKNILTKIIESPSLIEEYAIKAYEFGSVHLNKKNIQKMLYQDFLTIIKK